jgi:hypothetical protein
MKGDIDTCLGGSFNVYKADFHDAFEGRMFAIISFTTIRQRELQPVKPYDLVTYIFDHNGRLDSKQLIFKNEEKKEETPSDVINRIYSGLA